MSPVSKWFFDLAERLFGDKKEEEILAPYIITQSASTSYSPSTITTTATYVPTPIHVNRRHVGISGSAGVTGSVGISGMMGSYTTFSGMYNYVPNEKIKFGFTLRFKSDAKLKVSWPEEAEYDEDKNKLKKLI